MKYEIMMLLISYIRLSEGRSVMIKRCICVPRDNISSGECASKVHEHLLPKNI